MHVDISWRRFLLYFFILCILPNFLFYLQSRSDENDVNKYSPFTGVLEDTSPGKMISSLAQKWIVITSIADEPPEAVWKLLDEPEWYLVVVADMKGPKIRWTSHAKTHFLSVQDQLSLGYHILKHVPYNSYTRKMVGYLYAIEHGAQWIYDTDDDNSPINQGLKQFDYEEMISGMLYQRTNNKETFDIRNVIFNPYAYFGRPNMWPRGYPLSQLRPLGRTQEDSGIGTTTEVPPLTSNQMHNHRLCKSVRRPLVQQGLVAKDPDVDAIYRLINADRDTGLNVIFDHHAPPIVLKPGVYSPFNSQNTLFHRDAFFVLWLPVTVAFRVTDIWRGYFAQRLIHLIGGTIGFYPVNAIQKRNPHNYFNDFKEEGALYNDTEKLIEVMDEWNCTFNSIDLCLIDLAQLFVRQHFWGKEELDLAKAWITDLHRIGYRFPAIDRTHENGDEYSRPNCRRAFLSFNVNTDPEQNRDEGILDLFEWCNVALDKQDQFPLSICDQRHRQSTKMEQNLQNKALVITSNYQFISSISVLQRLYGGIFAHIIFCGPFYPQLIFRNDSGFLAVNPLSYIHLYENEMHEGYFAYYCTAKAIELRLQNIDGFIVMADDAIYNPWNWIELNRFRLQGVTHRAKNTWWKTEYGGAAINNTIVALKERTTNEPYSKLAQAWEMYNDEVDDGSAVLSETNIWGVSDWYFVPTANFTVFYELAELMFENRVFHEIAVPKIGAGLKWLEIYHSGDLDIPNGLHIWHNRGCWFDMYNQNLLYFHPVKLSPFGKYSLKRAQFCRSVIAAFRTNLWNAVNKSTVPENGEGWQNQSKTAEGESSGCCTELVSASCQNLCISSEMKLSFIYEVLASIGSCSESAASITAYFTCRIHHAEEVNSSKLPEIFANFSHDSEDLPLKKTVLDAHPEIIPGNSGSDMQNLSLEIFAVPDNGSTLLNGSEVMLFRQNSVRNCCRKNLIHRATSGERCTAFCDGDFVLEEVEKRKYVSCMEVMMHILNCYTDTTYQAHLIDHFLSTENLENEGIGSEGE